ncbi:MAG: hypothetical protein H7831_15005 [Magnetococcus sp. WYHC-3]
MNPLGCIVVTVVTILLPVQQAHAYVGPGAGLSAIGTALALLSALLLAVLGFLWYPLKRLWKRLRKPSESPDQSSAEPR